MKTETVQTKYGSVEVETVECDSCGNRIGKEESYEFILGDREGFACSHCVGEGPISFPDKVRNWVRPNNPSKENVSFIFAIGLAVLIVPMTTIDGFKKDSDPWFDGFAVCSIIYLFYISVALGLWWLL